MGFFFTLLLTALIYLRPQEYVEAIKGWPIIDWTAMGCLAGVFLEGAFSADKLKRSPIPMLLLFFWLVQGLSWLFNGWLGGITFVIINWSPVAITFYLVVLTVDTQRKLKIYIWVLVTFCSFLALESMLVFYTGEGLTGATALESGGVMQTRGVGIFADPNDLCNNMVPMTAFLLPAFHRHLMSRTWLTGVPLLVPFINGIVLTRSRGGMLGLLSVGWMYLRNRAGNVVAVVVIAMVFSLILALPRMGQIDTEEESARNRLDHWAYGLTIFKANPLLGVGVGNFIDYGNYTHTAHNSLVLVLAETGFTGTFLWLSMWFCAFLHLRDMRSDSRAPPWVLPFCNSMETALVGWAVCAFFLSQTFKPLLYILLAMVTAGVNVLAGEGMDYTMRWTGRDTMIMGAATVGAVIFMHLAVKVLWNL